MIQRLVFNVGMPHSGAAGVQSVLSRWAGHLRRSGAAFIGDADLAALPSSNGWRARAAFDRNQAEPFAHELRHLVEAMAERSGRRPLSTLILASEHALGEVLVDRQDGHRFQPHAEESVQQVIDALPAERVDLVVYTHRQDRLLEYCYVKAVADGSTRAFEEEFPYWSEPSLDYRDLFGRLTGLSRVDALTVWPHEAAARRPLLQVEHLLRTAGIRRGAWGAGHRPPAPETVLNPRGLALARAMNAFLETVEERERVAAFLLERFGTTDLQESAVIGESDRSALLSRYAAANRQAFEEYVPGLAAGSYDSDVATSNLARSFPGRSTSGRLLPQVLRRIAPPGARISARTTTD